MNCIIGMISPLMNWARKAASYSLVLRLSNSASTSSRRPKTFTRSCPVNASSMCAFSSPVFAHWAMNCFCERLAICWVTTSDTGIDTSAITVSSGETRNIITRTPTTVSTEFSNWLRVCCRLCCTLSMSLVTRLSSSPRGCLSK